MEGREELLLAWDVGRVNEHIPEHILEKKERKGGACMNSAQPQGTSFSPFSATSQFLIVGLVYLLLAEVYSS